MRHKIKTKEEFENLDNWAEDKKTSIELQLKELDKEIKFRKTEARKIQVLEENLKARKIIKEMESRRNSLRQTLFSEQDAIDRDLTPKSITLVTGVYGKTGSGKGFYLYEAVGF